MQPYKHGGGWLRGCVAVWPQLIEQLALPSVHNGLPTTLTADLGQLCGLG